MLRAYGYAVAETTHDCGELGGLAQSRKRFLLVARHIEQVPPMLYQPDRRPLRAVGDVLGRMPLPGDLRAGPMHRIPALQWKTWVRLAFVRAGGDWRSLNRLDVADGVLRDYLIVPDMHVGTLGVRRWNDPCGTVTGNARPATGAFSVADWQRAAGTVISGSTTGQGAYGVADPRSGLDIDRSAYQGGGHYGVLPWESTSGAVSAAACHDNGRWSVADPRTQDGTQNIPEIIPAMPAAADKLVCRIVAEDGTWHRPFTTLELAALQSLVNPEEQLELDGLSDQAWRERIGNAVPSAAAQAIAEVMGRTLLLAWIGETFELSSQPIWVRPMAVALSVSSGAQA